jgi:hypothetical protein
MPPRRSTALVQPARIRFQELLDEDEFARFSSETRATVHGFLDIWGPNHPIQADVKGRAALAFAFIHCFLGFFGMPCLPSHRSL